VGLLQQGYAVRTTVRNLDREPQVRAALGKAVDPGNRLAFFAADLMSDAGWEEAARGCEYVVHVASPLGVIEPKDPNELIVPAREGARRAINAAIKAGAKRVVMTSSVAACHSSLSHDTLDDETVWTDLKMRGLSAYTQSKTVAERAAWDLVKSSGNKIELAVVNPTLVLGPVLSGDFSDSVQVVARLMSGNVPGLPRLGFNVVDVRDLAELHIRAMTAPDAAGQRFIGAGRWAWMAEMAQILRDRLGADAKKVPSRKVPDFVLRLVSLFDKQLASVTPGLNRKNDFTAAKALKTLGWRSRPLEDTLTDCGKSLAAAGLV
jgi:nucleoside-diphosphate-sugar epimerase